MQKLDHSPVKIAFPAVRNVDASTHLDSGSDTSRRLLVIVSDADFDAPTAARRILEVANAFKSRVLFLGLYTDEAQEPSLHRQLITLSALVGDGQVSVESKIEFGGNWLHVVKSNWREGDIVVCFSGQYAGSRRKPLAQLLESNLSATVYVINNQSQPDRAQSNWKSAALAWAGSIGIVLGFFWLQVRIDQASSNWVGSTMLLLSIFIEVCLVWIWNSLFG